MTLNYGIYGNDFPAGGHWPGDRDFINLAELSGLKSARPGARNSINVAELAGLTPAWPGARNSVNLAELSGVTAERSDTQVPRRRPILDRPSQASVAAINIAAVRALVDEKRRAMSASEWAKATDDGAMVARGLRALKTLPDPQAAMPAFRRKMADVGVTEGTIASLPQTWDPRLADVVIAAHGEMGKLPAPPSRRVRGGRAVPDGANDPWTGDARREFDDAAPNFVRTRIPHHFDFGQSQEEKQLIEKRLDEVELDLRRRVQEWRDAGHLTAAEHLERFLKSEGGTKTITREEARRFPFAREAEATARLQFETESFLAKSGDNRINNALKGLKDRDEPVDVTDHWVRVLGPVGFLKEWYAGDKNLARAFGKTNIRSDFDGHAVRRGNTIYITGEVTHSWNDPYDFERFQPGSSGPFALGEVRSGKEIRHGGVLEPEGERDRRGT